MLNAPTVTPPHTARAAGGSMSARSRGRIIKYMALPTPLAAAIAAAIAGNATAFKGTALKRTAWRAVPVRRFAHDLDTVTIDGRNTFTAARVRPEATFPNSESQSAERDGG